MIGYSMHNTCLAIGVPQMLMKHPSACSKFWVIMLIPFHENAFEPINCSPPRPVARIRALVDLKVMAHSAGGRSSSLPGVVYLAFSLLILVDMADSSSSIASSPDPLVELEAEVKILRR